MKKYLYLILFFLVCVPAIAGTINSYTLKSPPDDADTIVIYDSDDGSTKKIEVGDISGSGTESGWTDGGSNVYLTVTTDSVAIGTTTPTHPLTVVGTVSATSFVGDGSGLTGVSTGWTDGGTNVYTTLTTDTVSIGTTTSSASLEIVEQSGVDPFMVSSVAGGSGDNFTITSAGNIGIGTSKPSAMLRIKGNGSSLMSVTNSSLNSVFSVADNGTVGIGTGATSGAVTINNSNAGPLIVNSSQDYTTNGNIIQFRNNPLVLGAPVSGDGLVGLWVQACSGGSSCSNLTGADITFKATNTWVENTSPPTDIRFSTANTTTTRTLRMVITEAGNVGLGTVRPEATLNIIKSGSIKPLMVSSSASGLGDYLVMNSGGNIGIGTISPGAYKIDIVGGGIRAIGIGTTVPQQLCRKEDGTFGYFDGAWAGTCN